MGYAAITIIDSDMASDCAANAVQAMVKSLKKSLKDDGGEFNTDGPVNVALFFSEMLAVDSDWAGYEELVSLARSASEGMSKIIKSAENDGCWKDEVTARGDWKMTRLEHIERYRELNQCLLDFIGSSE